MDRDDTCDVARSQRAVCIALFKVLHIFLAFAVVCVILYQSTVSTVSTKLLICLVVGMLGSNPSSLNYCGVLYCTVLSTCKN